MDLLFEIEYITERERRNAIDPHHHPRDVADVMSSSPVTEYLRELLHTVPNLHLIVRPFDGVFDARH